MTGPAITVELPVLGAQQLIRLAVAHGDLSYTEEGIALANTVQMLTAALEKAGHVG